MYYLSVFYNIIAYLTAKCSSFSQTLKLYVLRKGRLSTLQFSKKKSTAEYSKSKTCLVILNKAAKIKLVVMAAKPRIYSSINRQMKTSNKAQYYLYKNQLWTCLWSPTINLWGMLGGVLCQSASKVQRKLIKMNLGKVLEFEYHSICKLPKLERLLLMSKKMPHKLNLIWNRSKRTLNFQTTK